MKRILRTFIFSCMGMGISIYVINAFDFGEYHTKTFLLVALAISLLYIFLKPILVVVSLPSSGFGFVFMNFVLTFVVLYFLTMFVSDFSIKETTLSDLIIFGFVLPSKSLTSLWSGVFSAFVIGIVYAFMEGLCSK